MGSFMNKMLNLVGFDPEDEYEEEYEEERDIDTGYEEPVFDRFSERRSSKVVKMHNSNVQMRVVVIQPESFEETRDITNHLKSNKPVVINLEAVEREVARRIIDFLSGAVYAIDGSMEKVSNGIFILAPSNIEIMSDSIKENMKSEFPWN